MDAFYSIISFFSTGGMFMFPILVVFAFGVAIAVERFVTLNAVTSKNQAVWEKVQPLLDSGDFEEAREMTSEDDSTISQVLNMGLSLQGAVRRREDIEIAMEESMMEIVPRRDARPARYDHGPDPGIYGCRQCQSGRKGRSAVGQYFGGDEHDGIRPDGRDSVAHRARHPDQQDRRYRRQPGDGDREGTERFLTQGKTRS